MAYPLSYFVTRQRTTPDWIIPNLLKRKNTAFLIGEPKKACKSWLFWALAWDLSEGKPVWGIRHSKRGPIFVPSRPMRTVYFSQEDTEDDLHDRFSLLTDKGRRVPNDNMLIVPRDLRMSFDTPDGLKRFTDHITTTVEKFGKVDLLLFDPFRRIHSKEENSSEVMVHVWKVLDALYQQYDCSAMISHHTVKPPKEAVAGSTYDPTSPFVARGSGDIFGGADAFINSVPRSARGKFYNSRPLNLHFETKRSRPLFPAGVSVSFETGLVSFDGFVSGSKVIAGDPPDVDNTPLNESAGLFG